MKPAYPSWQPWVLMLLCAIPIIGSLFASTGLFTIDELIYAMATHAMATQQSFIIENGYDLFGSDDLKLWFLVEGPNGLTSQYPPGMTLISAPFYALMGTRGMILVNAIAAAGVIIITYQLALLLYRSPSVARVSVLILMFCSFFVEYALGVWPHMLSAFLALAAFYLAMRATRLERQKEVALLAILSGVAVGAGVLVRTDAILVLPVIACCVILFATRPYTMILGGALGLLPCIVLGALINLFKFGTLNVLSYGRNGTGGGDDLTSHAAALLIVAILLAGLVIARNLTWSPGWRWPLWIGLAILTGLVAALPGGSSVLDRVFNGVYFLFVDSRTTHDVNPGIIHQMDGTVLFWGTAKKALGQSLPWLGLLAALLVAPWRQADRRAHISLLLFAALWTLPFVPSSWHGGFSSNMRYFLPMVPALSILAAVIVVRLAETARSPLIPIVAGAVLVFAVNVILLAYTGWTTARLQQELSLYLLGGIGVITLLYGLTGPDTRNGVTVMLTVTGIGLGSGLLYGVVGDLIYAQFKRQSAAVVSDAAATIDGPVLFHGPPTYFASMIERPDGLLGIDTRLTGKADPDLFTDALTNGYRIFTTEGIAQQLKKLDGFGMAPSPIELPGGRTIEIVAAE